MPLRWGLRTFSGDKKPVTRPLPVSPQAPADPLKETSLDDVKKIVSLHQVTYARTSTGSITLTNVSQQIFQTKEDRLFAVIVNDSANVVYLALGLTATTGQGIRLNANGGTFWFGLGTDFPYTGPVSGVASQSSNLTLVEY